MGRRHKLDIVAKILELARPGINRTGLVYQANINFTILKNYLEILEAKGFIEAYDKKLYSTVVGMEFLEKYWQLMEVWNVTDNATRHASIESRQKGWPYV